MGLAFVDLILALILNLMHCGAYAEHILLCDPNALPSCSGDHQICNETSKECVCTKGFVFVGDDCKSSDASAGTDATVAVVVTFTLALIVCGLILVIRKYNLIDHIRQKIYARGTNDIMYEDVMIGQDDPPLSP